MAVAGIYIAVGLATMVAYWRDKRAARRGRRRTRERSLHLLELAGGCIGGLISRPLFRHKTVDTRFRIVSWIIIAIHLSGWIAFVAFRAR